MLSIKRAWVRLVVPVRLNPMPKILRSSRGAGILRGMRVLLLALLLGLPVSAEQVFVRNLPFQGVVRGSGSAMLVELAPLLQMLGVSRPPDVPVIDASGVQLVNLHAFARAAGARLVANPQLQTVDIVMARPRVDWTLVHYTASWCGPCRQLQPVLQRLAQEQQLQLITVDTDRETPERAHYIRFFEGRRFPFLVLLGPTGRPVGRWSGSPTYAQLADELTRAKSSGR